MSSAAPEAPAEEQAVQSYLVTFMIRRFDPEVDRKVSALHAELREGEHGEVTLHDLGSRNGVLLNGEKIEASARVVNLGSARRCMPAFTSSIRAMFSGDVTTT